MDIIEIAKQYTREEFIDEQSQQVFKPSCPHKFKLVDYFPKCSAKVFDCEECWENAVKDIKFKDEEKAICIDNKGFDVDTLTQGKEYIVKQSKEHNNCYDVVNDFGVEDTFKKERFDPIMHKIKTDNGEIILGYRGTLQIKNNNSKIEGEKMEEKTIKVRCIKALNFKDLTLDKEYPVIEIEPEGYKIINDIGVECVYLKKFFKPVEPQKEVKEINYEEEYYKLNDKIRGLQEEVKIYYDLAKERSDYGNLKKENEEKNNLIVKIRTEKDNQIEKLGAKITMLELDNDKLKDENTKLNNSMKLLQSENDEYIEALEKVRAENRELGQQARRLGKSTDKYYYNWIECQEENRKLKEKPNAINNYEAEINQLKCSIEEAKYYIETLEAKAEENKEKLENYKLLKNLMKILVEGL